MVPTLRHRILISTAAAVGVTLGIFGLMIALLPQSDPPDQQPTATTIRFGHPPPPEETRPKTRRPPEIRSIRRPPGVARLELPKLEFEPEATALSTPLLDRDVLMRSMVEPGMLDFPGLGGFVDVDGLVPKVLMPPMYPPRGLTKGIEGEVLVRFTVNPKGRVVRAEIVEAEPANVFEEATLRAVYKWRFEPVVVDGEPSTVTAEQLIGFKLVDDVLAEPGS